MKRPARALLAALLLALCLVAATVPATAASPPPVKRPVATGTGEALRPMQSGKVNQYGALLFGAAAVAAIVLVIVNV